MPSKQSIRSYNVLDRRIKKFRQRAGSLDPATFPVKPANWTGFVAFETLWNTEYAQFKQADSAKQEATAQVITATNELFMYCSHYLQVLFLAIKRGEIPASVLALYGLPVSNEPKLPDMDSEAKLLQVASNIISGDAARVAAGGVAMSNPAVAQVEAKLLAYNNLQNTQSITKETFRKEQTDVASIFLQGVEVMRKLYVDIEYNYSDQSHEYINDILREWGMEFYNGPGEEFTTSATVAAGTTFTLSEIALAEGNTITLTLKTNLPGPDGVFACKNTSGGCDTGATALTFNTPVTATYEQLSGDGTQLQLTNMSAVDVVVDVKVVG